MNSDISKEHKQYLKNIKKRKELIFFTQISILILFFGLWEIAANQKWIDPFIFSSPSRMYKSFLEMLETGMIWKHLFVTTAETVIGFVLGTILGTAIAMLLWWNDFLSDVLEPYLVVLNSLPKTALAPILIVWLGNNPKSIIATALMTSVIVTIMSVLNGFLAVDKEKIKLIHTFSGSKRQVLFKVVLPASLESIMNALKINVGLSFVGVIVGEFLVAGAGIGYLIVYGSQIFKLDWVMLSVILLAILATIMYKSVVFLEKIILKKRRG